MARRRLGVVLLVPEPVATEVDGLRRALGDGALGRLPAHLTLVPPVNVRADDLPAALAVLRRAGGDVPPVDLRLGPPATFLPVTPVVYLSVAGDLDDVHDLRQRVLRPPLARATTHPFVPHVTVADDMAPGLVPGAVAALAGYVVDVRIGAVTLLEERRGRVWVPVAEVPLGGRRRPGRRRAPVGSLQAMAPDMTQHDTVAQATADAERAMRPQSVPVNMWEAGDALVVVAALPAVQPEDVAIDLWPGRLRITASLRSAAPRDYLLHEWDYGGFERELDLPPGWGGGAEASLANGQLAVRVLPGRVDERTTVRVG